MTPASADPRETTSSTPGAGGSVLVTGATGYVGGRLVPELLERGWRVRVLTRRAARLDGISWARDVDVVEGDATSADDLRRALDGVDAAYYLLHSMDAEGSFVERDRAMATAFADAAAEGSVSRIVYLGGLHPPGEDLSPHLASRVEVGEILLASGVPTAVIQAGVVLGDGSASFDMLRHLTERLPAFVAPRWLRNRIQPIGVDDVLDRLVAAAELAPEHNRTFDVGGPEVLTYAEMMQRYATVTGLRRRLILTLPVLTPGLASHWVGLVTPVPAGVAKPLVGSLVHDAVVHERDLDDLVGPPEGGPTGYDEAIRRATAQLEPRRWSRRLRWTLAVVGGAAVVGSLATDPGSRWYRGLDLPPWQPPTIAFPVVWTTLYATTAIASTAVSAELEEDGRGRQAAGYRRALVVNMVLNAGWSALFFRGHQVPGLRQVVLPAATAEAATLAASSWDLTRRAAAAGRGKGATLGAYAAWCTFAVALTAEIWRRNRG
ncbi:tryptophan-rich sensory protein [Janibacter alkaliphilus]|uniref:Uncharacterized protein YbjT (DUF2867 family)/tryptophan-rich sensory protein n=1 Tax=Janibacter alkaliphilus TaxID=1069963 RepID=A0A852X9D8_9MICO|nr:tryptophan-rich sensory protein [Janibacter alkaliphilus]NYG37353.1 uncharacterized protein YbjT (DUF2867 family)/tryptophan-rich sensory protein [Janibacter alkaliphilus]